MVGMTYWYLYVSMLQNLSFSNKSLGKFNVVLMQHNVLLMIKKSKGFGKGARLMCTNIDINMPFWMGGEVKMQKTIT